MEDIDRSTCPRPVGAKHGTEGAYRCGCRCPDAVADSRRRRKLRAYGLGDPGLVPGIGTARRIRALSAIGWSTEALAHRYGISPGRVRSLRNPGSDHRRGDHVLHTTAERWKQIYDELSMMPGPSAGARITARRFGFAPPLLWEGRDIDDPKARPLTDRGRRPRRTTTEAA